MGSTARSGLIFCEKILMEKLLQDFADFVGQQWAHQWLERLRRLQDERMAVDARRDQTDNERGIRTTGTVQQAELIGTI